LATIGFGWGFAAPKVYGTPSNLDIMVLPQFDHHFAVAVGCPVHCMSGVCLLSSSDFFNFVAFFVDVS
jgi:hypothetical protein